MNKIVLVFTVLAVIIALVDYWKFFKEVEPEVMPEDVWWGLESDRVNFDRNTFHTQILPFQINISDRIIGDLKDRLSKTRSLAKPLENVNFEYGFNSDRLSEILDHWANRYDWTARQAYLNGLPQFKTRIYGLDVHFVHAKPASVVPGGNVQTVIPLLLLHGWPGSVVEFYEMIPLLTAGDARGIAFEVIAPSLPGYGFSEPAVRPGMGPAQIGQMFVELMRRLGHGRFYVQGGDWGSIIAETISTIYPDRVRGMHSNFCSVTSFLTLGDYTRLILGAYWPSLAVSSEIEKSRTYPLSELLMSFLEETGYMHLQMTKPDTVGVGLTDSPAGLAAYILEKFSSWTNLKNKHLLDGGLSKYNINALLDNVMIYWVTGSITTSMRLYSEYASKHYQTLPHKKAKVKVPAACALFPEEMAMALNLKKFLKIKYINLVSATEMKEGGHFAAFEQPKLLAEDIRSSIIAMEAIQK
uniref:Epoxide hydrolase n=1 Tax=Sipha flava TaxID=143950 RepID=A0A2S2Q119_9HEMI